MKIKKLFVDIGTLATFPEKHGWKSSAVIQILKRQREQSAALGLWGAGRRIQRIGQTLGATAHVRWCPPGPGAAEAAVSRDFAADVEPAPSRRP